MGPLIRRSLAGTFLAALVFVALFPILWTLLGSFKELRDIVTTVPKLFFTPTLQNYIDVLTTRSVQTGLYNSVVVVGSSVAIGVLLGVPVAYALARFPIRLKPDIQFFVLSLRFMPPVAVAIPFITIYMDLGLNDTLISVVITYCLTTISTIIWLAAPAFEQVPREIEEAASLEGYSPFGVFIKVALPVAMPSLIGAVLFTFVIIWNELLIALVLTSQSVTLPVVAAGFTTLGMEVPWGVINASTILLALPPLLFIGLIMRFVNRYFKAMAR